MTQLERVLKASRRFNGVCQHDFNLPDVCDGGPPITRVAARIEEAQSRHGCRFEVLPWRKGFKVYRLVSEPDVDGGGGHSIPPERASVSMNAGDSPLTDAARKVAAAAEGRLFDAGRAQYGFADQERAA